MRRTLPSLTEHQLLRIPDQPFAATSKVASIPEPESELILETESFRRSFGSLDRPVRMRPVRLVR
jgi:hypothetical protein